ncbi:hypothetical protein PQ472_05865 [Lacticaseibacillus pabuli]|uniref:Transmembrane protein n=1 Tax=Lacticaseibacillus pabuli TaxID=3025672 RepID=A0ABY7WUC0_9LACO|nr:hypothetical protein [Lacticaseibacillus sp. KACC 23028]WDF83763.1 hypothetical protein PQ472_05865 [Lacticaseibacillus sp. KACC 23028]
MRKYRKILFCILAVLIVGLWSGSVIQGLDTGHARHVAIVAQDKPKIELSGVDPVASVKPSSTVESGCLVIVGIAATLMLVWPLAAWQMTIEPIEDRRM